MSEASLGGVPLTDADTVSWSIRSGTNPPLEQFVVHDSQWDKVAALLGRPTTLKIGGSSFAVWPVREGVTSKPFHRAVQVSDVRWKWQYTLVHKDFNIRRQTGVRRIVNGEVVELGESIPDEIGGYKYTRVSTNGGEPWDASSFLSDVVSIVTNAAGGGYEIDSLPVSGPADGGGVTVQDLRLSENGSSAISRALRAIPGTGIYVDAEGRTHVFDRANPSAAAAAMEEVGPATERGQIVRGIDLAGIRPSGVDVHFTKDVELRFDSREEGDSGTSVAPGADADALMDNVLPLPDPETTINGQRVAQGTYVPAADALTAWNSQLSTVEGAPELNIENVRKFWFYLESFFTPLGNLADDADESNWSARIAAIRTHFRQTYRIPKQWMDRISDVKPIRVGILDPFSGYRAPAQAWSQYTVEPTTKNRIVTSKDKEKQTYWIDKDDYPGFDGELYTKLHSPAVVQLVDKAQGIFRINYRLDPHGMRSAIHPSRMEGGGSTMLPNRAFDQRGLNGATYARDIITEGANPMELSASHRVAIVFTATPAAPNSKARLLKVGVEPGDLSTSYSEQFGAFDGRGPRMQIAIPPTVMTAWYAIVSSVTARNTAAEIFGFSSEDGAGGGAAGNAQGGEAASAASEDVIPDNTGPVPIGAAPEGDTNAFTGAVTAAATSAAASSAPAESSDPDPSSVPFNTGGPAVKVDTNAFSPAPVQIGGGGFGTSVGPTGLPETVGAAAADGGGGGAADDAPGAEAGGDDLGPTAGYEIINHGTGSLLREIAHAWAAAVWAAFTDHIDGTHTAHLSEGVTVPAGSLGAVTYRLDTDGAMTISLSFDPERPATDPMAILPAAYRKFLVGGIPASPA